MEVTNFQTELNGLFDRPRSAADIDDYLLSRGQWKKLADEVMPVSRFLRFREVESGRIRFPLDSHSLDAWLWRDGLSQHVEIEVTVAQGTARFRLNKELVDTGEGRGFIGVSDDAPKSEFDSALSELREMSSTEQVLSAYRDGFFRCLDKKDKQKFCGAILVIQASLYVLPRERWETIADAVRTRAAGLPFQEAYVICDHKPWGFQIK